MSRVRVSLSDREQQGVMNYQSFSQGRSGMRPGDRGFPSIPGVKQAPQTPCSHDRAASTPVSINFSAIVSPVPTATLTPDRAATTVKTSPCACRKSNPVHAGPRDLKPELEQFAVNAWRTPKRILHAHPPDQ